MSTETWIYFGIGLFFLVAIAAMLAATRRERQEFEARRARMLAQWEKTHPNTDEETK
ncbi:hypothetical protein SEA_PUPPER_226 [Gordonia phage Pupper]|uniref:Uncharacterized protein n=1 Tax=Gordonia phage Pupper TaxID=2571249 RepID=A0A4Y6EJR3_9CAUD|nr:hypothetical protein KHQ83_gp051 [Gordonia phage Pupper]QDF18712.1 hypothetical protein SEA_PUPPER_226 [Gordonia phage Pupper]QDF18945.1 hypothetical protein SEA_SCENTAE_226 [Gordonia phage SCentae]